MNILTRWHAKHLAKHGNKTRQEHHRAKVRRVCDELNERMGRKPVKWPG